MKGVCYIMRRSYETPKALKLDFDYVETTTASYLGNRQNSNKCPVSPAKHDEKHCKPGNRNQNHC